MQCPFHSLRVAFGVDNHLLGYVREVPHITTENFKKPVTQNTRKKSANTVGVCS